MRASQILDRSEGIDDRKQEIRQWLHTHVHRARQSSPPKFIAKRLRIYKERCLTRTRPSIHAGQATETEIDTQESAIMPHARRHHSDSTASISSDQRAIKTTSGGYFSTTRFCLGVSSFPWEMATCRSNAALELTFDDCKDGKETCTQQKGRVSGKFV